MDAPRRANRAAPGARPPRSGDRPSKGARAVLLGLLLLAAFVVGSAAAAGPGTPAPADDAPDFVGDAASAGLHAPPMPRRLAPRQLPSGGQTYAWFDVVVQKPGTGQRGRRVHSVVARGLGADRDGDVTAQLQRGIDECARVVRDRNVLRCQLVLTRGRTYRLTSLVVPAGMRDFTLVGAQATLVFTRDNFACPPEGGNEDGGCRPYFDVRGCTRCQFQYFTVDWDWNRWRIASLVRLLGTAHDYTSNISTWTFRIESPSNPPGGLNTDTLFQFQSILPVDPDTLTIGVRNTPEFYLTGATAVWGGRTRLASNSAAANLPKEVPAGVLGDPNARVVKVDNVRVAPAGGGGGLSPNIITSSPVVTVVINRTNNNDFGSAEVAPSPVGSLWMIKHLTYEVHGFRLRSCVHCTLLGINVRSVPGKAVMIDARSESIEVTGLNVVMQQAPSIGGPRTMSGAADGIFAAMTRGNILIRDSNFAYLGDDPINVHIPTSMHNITYGADRSTIVVARSPAWRVRYSAGEYIQFLDADFVRPLGIFRRIVTASYNPWAGEGTWTLRLASPVPDLPIFNADPPISLGIANVRWSARNVIVRNVRTSNHRARGLLVQAVENVVVENCSFRRVQQAGILVRPCAATQEGIGVTNAVFANNVFDGVDVTGWNAAAMVEVMNRRWQRVPSENRNSDIRMINNRISQAPSYAIDADSAANLYIANTVSTPSPNPADEFAGRIGVTFSTNVTRTGNVFCGSSCERSEAWVSIDY
ncbi:pectin lyase fold/virulence factor [Hyaloraphidium curvatum]|nr:pectin lyase fold/virulence factor [Hyaloraphidium curvatum]